MKAVIVMLVLITVYSMIGMNYLATCFAA